MTADLLEVDEPTFSGLAERHRRELHVHCYRMLGSFEDAEDTVQETFLRAWRRRETFEGRSTFRAWLYRIATNASLDLLEKRRPEPATGGEVLWLQPYPDALLDELPADDADHPESRFARETIELAYVAAVQHLAPRPAPYSPAGRARLAGQGVAEPSATPSTPSTARSSGLAPDCGSTCPPSGRTGPAATSTPRRATSCVASPTPASATDINTLAAMLRDDVRYSMPPTPGFQLGRDAVVEDWIADGFDGMTGLHQPVLTFANRQPALAFYFWNEQEGAYLPLVLDVLRITDGAVAEIIVFHDDQFGRFGLPERLPAS